MVIAARVAVICLAGLAFVFIIAHGHRVTTSETIHSSVETWTHFTSQEECIYRSIRSDLPSGATVHVVDSDPYDAERLIELSTGWAVPTQIAAPASWTIGLVPGSSCAGVTLNVHRT